MGAGKERLTRDTVRDATRQETGHLKREDYDLKRLVADLSLEVNRFKKAAIPPQATLDKQQRAFSGLRASYNESGPMRRWDKCPRPSGTERRNAPIRPRWSLRSTRPRPRCGE